MTDFLDHVGASSFVVDGNAKHVHPRPRGDLVLCDGRCGARLPLIGEVDAAEADTHARAFGWLVTTSMLRSFHWCGACRGGVSSRERRRGQ